MLYVFPQASHSWRVGPATGVKAFVDSSNKAATERGYVNTLLGRHRPIRELRSGSARERGDGLRKVVNSMIQGSAADVVKLVMCKWDDWCGAQGSAAPARLVAQIHDELLFEVQGSAVAVQQVTQVRRAGDGLCMMSSMHGTLSDVSRPWFSREKAGALPQETWATIYCSLCSTRNMPPGYT